MSAEDRPFIVFDNDGFEAPQASSPIGDPVGCLPTSKLTLCGNPRFAGTPEAMDRRSKQDAPRDDDVIPHRGSTRAEQRGRPMCVRCGSRRQTCGDRCNARRCRA